MTAPPAVQFRHLREDDFPLMHRWLQTPHVQATYGLGKEWNVAAIREKYIAYVEGRIAMHGFVIEIDGRAAGFIQTYRLLDHGDGALQNGVNEEWYGLDLFLGEPELVGRGLGSQVIERFATEQIFGTTRAVTIVADPPSGNRRSWRAFEKAGFRLWRRVSPVDEGSGDLLMRLDRPTAGCGVRCVPALRVAGRGVRGRGWASSPTDRRRSDARPGRPSR